MKRPEICIPITECTRDAIIERAREYAGFKPEIVEWRVDFYAGYEREIPDVVKELKAVLREKKLIVTLRTTAEGGEENGARFAYNQLLAKVIEDGAADYVDVEIQRDEGQVKQLMQLAQGSAARIIGSCHDFKQTPPKEEIKNILSRAKQLGADVGKFACMPRESQEKGKEDVQTLLDATWEMKQENQDFPLITMSMGEVGKMSRLYGGLYGSSVSFGCAAASSAPGQMDWQKMWEVFDKIYSGKKHIFLIGFMGTGKSTVSSELCQKTQWPEIDTDRQIVEEQNCSIAQIFEEQGEPYFRQLETNLLDELGTCPPAIVSCGGGMAVRDLNAKKMQALGEVVLLTAQPETIYERVKDTTDRPLLNGNMNVAYIRELMEKRRLFYEKAATVVVATDQRSVAEIADEILQKVSQHTET